MLWAMVEPPLEEAFTDCDLPLEDIERIAALVPEVTALVGIGRRQVPFAGGARGRSSPDAGVHHGAGNGSLPPGTAAIPRRLVHRRRRGPGPGAACPGMSFLSWFGPSHRWIGPGTPPALLLSTDVSAEGLDLQSAARVVHYDLPWTPVRLVQREGRALRGGSPHTSVEIVRFDPPAGIEETTSKVLAPGAERSPCRAEPASVPMARSLWRWRDELAARLGPGDAVEGVAAVPAGAEGPGLLAGVALVAATAGRGGKGGGRGGVASRGRRPIHRSRPGRATARRGRAGSAWQRPQCAGSLARAIAKLARCIRQRLEGARRDRWRQARATPGGDAR